MHCNLRHLFLQQKMKIWEGGPGQLSRGWGALPWCALPRELCVWVMPSKMLSLAEICFLYLGKPCCARKVKLFFVTGHWPGFAKGERKRYQGSFFLIHKQQPMKLYIYLWMIHSECHRKNKSLKKNDPKHIVIPNNLNKISKRLEHELYVK